jgi:hypothetical protein
MPSKAIIGHWKMLGNVQRERWHHEATGRDETRKGGYTEDDLFEPSRGGSWFVQTKIGKKYIVKVDEVGTVQRWIWDISVENNRVTPKVLEIIAWPEGSDSQSNRPIQRWSFLFDESYEMMGVYVCDAKGKLPWHTDYNDPAPGYSWKDKCNGELLKYVDDKRHE